MYRLWLLGVLHEVIAQILNKTKTKKMQWGQWFLQLHFPKYDYGIYQTVPLHKISCLLLVFIIKYISFISSGSKVFQVGSMVYKVHRVHGEQPLSQADRQFQSHPEAKIALLE